MVYRHKVKKAFSIAEAMMALLITSVAIGAAAPMITKQIRHNNLSSVQTNILGREISQAETSINMNTNKINDIKVNVGTVSGRVDVLYNNKFIRDFLDRDPSLPTYNEAIEEMEEVSQQMAQKLSNKVDASRLSSMENSLTNKISSEIEKLKEEFKSNFVPSGAVMAFRLAECPKGWVSLTNVVEGSAGAFIRNIGGNAGNLGAVQLDAAPNIEGTWVTIHDTVSSSSGNDARWTGAMKVEKQAGYGPGDWDSVTYIASFDASRSSAVYGRDKATEVRPKNVALLYCVKK